MSYQRDLAWVHDVGFGDFAVAAAPAVLDHLGSAGLAGVRVVDLGCGSGQLSRALIDGGYEVLGVDISPAMIERARRRVPEARFVVGSFRDVQLPACGAVVAVGEVLCYLLDENHGRESMPSLFHRVWRALEPGGLFLFDALAPGHEPGVVARRYRLESDWATLVAVSADPGSHILTRRITTFRRVGQHYRRSDETHRQQLFAADDLVTALRAIGFRVRLRRGYGALRFRGCQYAVVARKPRGSGSKGP